MPRVTLQTIADQVGVSRMTVSNAFSRPDQLSPELRTRILDAADKLGYAGPDPAARALARGTTGAVGILLTDSLRYAFTDEVAAAFLGAIADEMADSGLAITLLTSSELQRVVPARDLPMDGALIYSCDPGSTAVDWLRRRNLPLVFVDQVAERGQATINVADRAGAALAARHLIDLGHRRIDIVTSSFAGPHGLLDDAVAAATGHVQRERLIGWTDTLAAAGVTPCVVVEQHSDSEAGHRSGMLLLLADDPPTAVLCFSDAIASGVVQAARELDLDVPGDLSVVGFDDNPLAQRLRPPLTTIRQDVEAKGRAAGAALNAAMARARAGSGPRPKQVVLPVELVVRESTAPPRSGKRRARRV